MNALRNTSLALLLVGFAVLFARAGGGDGPTPGPTPSDLPIPASGRYFIMVKPADGVLSPALTAVVNSQTLEDEAEAAGMIYRVYTQGENMANVPQEFHAIVSELLQSPLPQFVCQDSENRTAEQGPVLDDLQSMLDVIKRVRGAR